MQQIHTIFERTERNGGNLVVPSYNPEFEDLWFCREPDVKCTVQWDGFPCLVHEGMLYRAFTKREKKQAPPGWQPWTVLELDQAADADQREAGRGWAPVNRNKKVDQMHVEAWLHLAGELLVEAKDNEMPDLSDTVISDGTYELIGPGINSNNHGFGEPTLVKHGHQQLDVSLRQLEALDAMLLCHQVLLGAYAKGIVFHRDESDMPDSPSETDRFAKVTRADFGIEWPDEALVQRIMAEQEKAQSNLVDVGGRPLR